jgi:ABC-2 type transport system permease protein
MTTPAPARSGVFSSAMRVFDLSLGEMLWSRRTVFMGLVVGLPVLLAVCYRVFWELGLVHNRAVSGASIFGVMIWMFFVRFIVPVLGVFYGTALIADEVEDKTITYLFTRPIPRSAVVLGKYFAYLACTALVVLPSVMLVWMLVAPLGGSLGTTFLDFVKDLAILAIGLAVYGALFAFVGTAIRRPLLVGLLFVFGWEVVVMALPGYLKRLSIAYYLQGLVPQAMPNDSTVSIVQAIFREAPPLSTSLFALGLITVVCLWIASNNVTAREYVLEQ